MYENVKVITEMAVSKKTGNEYTRVKLVFENGKTIIVGFQELAMKINWLMKEN